MPTNDLKIGIVGGYISGKATFLNALLKAPCFSMRSNTHNHILVEIQRSADEKISWEYMDKGMRTWSRAQDDIRCSRDHQRMRVKVPFFLWGNTVFYDFPQINDFPIWEKENISFVKQMDLIVCVFDAEYAMSSANKKTIDLLASVTGNSIAIILNKSDVVDNISNLSSQMELFFTDPEKKFPCFPISSKLELQRWNSPEKRQTTFAFTESRKNVMTICDLAFSDFRTWLYEKIFFSKYNPTKTQEK